MLTTKNGKMILLNIFLTSIFTIYIYASLINMKYLNQKKTRDRLISPKGIKKDLVVEDYELRSQKKYKFLLHNLEMDHIHLIQIYEIYLTYLTFSDPDSFLSPRVRNWEGIF